MTQPKFKVGDRVLVFADIYLSDQDRINDNCYCRAGHVGVISGFESGGVWIKVKEKVYKPSELKLCSNLILRKVEYCK